jgi:hypothetical protein
MRYEGGLLIMLRQLALALDDSLQLHGVIQVFPVQLEEMEAMVMPTMS